MAIFKDGAQQVATWNIKGHPHMQNLLRIIDGYCMLFWGTEVVVTSAIRPPTEKPSYHPKGQALDIRIKDRPEWVMRLMMQAVYSIQFLMEKFHGKHEIKGKFQVVRESDHLHIELDDGEPVCSESPVT